VVGEAVHAKWRAPVGVAQREAGQQVGEDPDVPERERASPIVRPHLHRIAGRNPAEQRQKNGTRWSPCDAVQALSRREPDEADAGEAGADEVSDRQHRRADQRGAREHKRADHK